MVQSMETFSVQPSERNCSDETNGADGSNSFCDFDFLAESPIDQQPDKAQALTELPNLEIIESNNGITVSQIFFADNRLAREIRLRAGVFVSVKEFRQSDGSLESFTTFKNGDRETCTTFRKDGTKAAYTIIDANNEKSSEIQYYDDGKSPAAEIRFKNGYKETVTKFRADGSTESKESYGDNRTKVLTTFDLNSKPVLETKTREDNFRTEHNVEITSFKDGYRNVTTQFDSGKKIITKYRSDGVTRDSVVKWISDDGQFLKDSITEYREDGTKRSVMSFNRKGAIESLKLTTYDKDGTTSLSETPLWPASSGGFDQWDKNRRKAVEIKRPNGETASRTTAIGTSEFVETVNYRSAWEVESIVTVRPNGKPYSSVSFDTEGNPESISWYRIDGTPVLRYRLGSDGTKTSVEVFDEKGVAQPMSNIKANQEIRFQ